MAAGLQIQSSIPASSTDVDNVVQERPACAGPAQRARCAHRLDLTLRWRELLESGAAQERLIVPGRPEGYATGLQLARIECKDLFGRRELVHVAQVLFKKRENRGTRKIIELDAQHAVLIVPHA